MKQDYHTKKILLVDDEKALLTMLSIVLRKEHFTEVYTAVNGKEALRACQEYEPDMIVLDIMLPDMDGYEVCRQIRTLSMAPILFLSAKSEEVDKLLSFAVGGDDYLTKPFSTREVVARITASLKRASYYEQKKDSTKITFGTYTLNLKKRELFCGERLVELTAKEYLILEYLMQNQGITISRKQLVDKVWGDAYEGYDNTVMVHIRHIREKIEQDPSNPVFLRTIKGRGYRFEKE